MRISPGTLLLGVVAVMFGLLGAYIVKKNMEQTPPVAVETAPAEPEMFVVPRAGLDLKAGREIARGDIMIYRMTADQVRSEELPLIFMSRPTDIIGRTLQVDIPKGSIFDSSMLYPEGTGPSIVSRLDPGMRAVTVKVTANEAVEGFATPGTFVDVLFRSEEVQDEQLPELTVNLIEGVKVLAVNKTTTEMREIGGQRNMERKTSVTLQVTPQEAVALRVVENRGTLALALRHPGDLEAQGNLAGMTLDELLNRPQSRTRIEVYRGHSISQVEFRERYRHNFDRTNVARDDANKQAKAPAADAVDRDAVK